MAPIRWIGKRSDTMRRVHALKGEQPVRLIKMFLKYTGRTIDKPKKADIILSVDASRSL